MGGTGFLDNWKPVDTSKETSKQVKSQPVEDLPSTSEVAQPITTSFQPASSIPTVNMDDFPDEALVEQEPPMPEPVVENPQPIDEPKPVASGDWALPKSANPAYKFIQVATSKHVRSVKPVLAGVVGPRKAGKSGITLDSLTDEEKKKGAMVWHIDFDAGGESTKSAHHSDSQSNLVVLNPWAYNKNSRSRVPYNYPETFNKTMDLLLYAQEVAEAQEEYFALHGEMPNPYLKTLVFDGMDHWLHICGIAMKIEDLELGDDAVAVSGQKTNTRIGRFNWDFRKNRYNSAMFAFRELCRMNVHTYVITGMKSSYDKNGNEILGADVAAWLKDTERDLEQLIEITLEEERDANGALTGKTVSKAQLKFNRTSLKIPEPVIIFEQEVGSEGVWNGFKGLYDGSFDSPDDVHETTEESA